MKVYVLVHADYELTRIHGIYSTLEIAQAAHPAEWTSDPQMPGSWWTEDWSIEEHHVDTSAASDTPSAQ